MGLKKSQVWQALQRVNDPEYPLSIVELGMVYNVDVNQNDVDIQVTFTAMGCPAIDMIISDIRHEVINLNTVRDLNVEIVWSPPWTKDKITPKGKEVLQYHGVSI